MACGAQDAVLEAVYIGGRLVGTLRPDVRYAGNNTVSDIEWEMLACGALEVEIIADRPTRDAQ